MHCFYALRGFISGLKLFNFIANRFVNMYLFQLLKQRLRVPFWNIEFLISCWTINLLGSFVDLASVNGVLVNVYTTLVKNVSRNENQVNFLYLLLYLNIVGHAILYNNYLERNYWVVPSLGLIQIVLTCSLVFFFSCLVSSFYFHFSFIIPKYFIIIVAAVSRIYLDWRKV